MDYALKNQVVLMIGASQGIGRSIALAIATVNPAVLILFAQSEDRLIKLAKEVKEISKVTQVVTKAVDIASSSAVSTAISASLMDLPRPSSGRYFESKEQWPYVFFFVLFFRSNMLFLDVVCQGGAVESWMLGMLEAVSVKALDVVPTSQRSFG